eukprot:TRINITY_DN1309_c0_g3_i2.p1 TRINITY_DN1309_c0_g3~~TRINITY_DN1309_c0_g3_i2.p1  ORF type:complete len:224 (-),score=53.56 TRINITY_DN1309_c0_g3_i2:133-759(-)
MCIRDRIIRNCLIKDTIDLLGTLEGKAMMAKSEDGKEYKVVLIDDLISLLSSLTKSLSPNHLVELKNLFRSFTNHREDFVLLQTLAELFGSADEELLEGIEELGNDAFAAVAGVLNYLEESSGSLAELLDGAVYQQEVSIDGETVTVDLVDAKQFYAILKKIGALNREDKDLSNFLCLDKKYPNVFLVKKFMKLVEHIALALEQQEEK